MSPHQPSNSLAGVRGGVEDQQYQPAAQLCHKFLIDHQFSHDPPYRIHAHSQMVLTVSASTSLVRPGWGAVSVSTGGAARMPSSGSAPTAGSSSSRLDTSLSESESTRPEQDVVGRYMAESSWDAANEDARDTHQLGLRRSRRRRGRSRVDLLGQCVVYSYLCATRGEKPEGHTMAASSSSSC